jgi:hypothetical protein
LYRHNVEYMHLNDRLLSMVRAGRLRRTNNRAAIVFVRHDFSLFPPPIQEARSTVQAQHTVDETGVQHVYGEQVTCTLAGLARNWVTTPRLRPPPGLPVLSFSLISSRHWLTDGCVTSSINVLNNLARLKYSRLVLAPRDSTGVYIDRELSFNSPLCDLLLEVVYWIKLSRFLCEPSVCLAPGLPR